MLNSPGLHLRRQYYKGLPLTIVNRDDYGTKRAKLFTIGDSDQTVWIPNSYLYDDGEIQQNAKLMWLFQRKDNYDKMTKARYKFTY